MATAADLGASPHDQLEVNKMKTATLGEDLGHNTNFSFAQKNQLLASGKPSSVLSSIGKQPVNYLLKNKSELSQRSFAGKFQQRKGDKVSLPEIMAYNQHYNTKTLSQMADRRFFSSAARDVVKGTLHLKAQLSERRQGGGRSVGSKLR